MRIIDRISDGLGLLAAWLFVVTGLMLTYEVVARYLFTAPTIWAAEISQVLMIAGVFLALGRTLHRRENIAIEVLHGRLGPLGRKLADSLALLFIAAFAGSTAYWGFGIAYDSFEKSRSSGTMLNIPNWWVEAMLPLGLAILVLQALVELWRVWRGAGWTKGQGSGRSSAEGGV